MAASPLLPDLPRVWMTHGLPGMRDLGATYTPVPLASLPDVETAEDLAWLFAEPEVPESLLDSPLSPRPTRRLDDVGVDALCRPLGLTLPPAFMLFAADMSLRSRLRSPTECYLDLGEFVSTIEGGGHCIHFLSDQQDALHWLVAVDGGGGQAVVCTPVAYGFEPEDHVQSRPGAAVVCAESFAEFVARMWTEAEIFYRSTNRDGSPLTDHQRAYADRCRTLDG